MIKIVRFVMVLGAIKFNLLCKVHFMCRLIAGLRRGPGGLNDDNYQSSISLSSTSPQDHISSGRCVIGKEFFRQHEEVTISHVILLL